MIKELKSLTRMEAKAKSDECRRLAEVAADQLHRAMLEDVAQSWDRIAESIYDEHKTTKIAWGTALEQAEAQADVARNITGHD